MKRRIEIPAKMILFSTVPDTAVRVMLMAVRTLPRKWNFIPLMIAFDYKNISGDSLSHSPFYYIIWLIKLPLFRVERKGK